jgi:hypothetical protein
MTFRRRERSLGRAPEMDTRPLTLLRRQPAPLLFDATLNLSLDFRF